MVDCPTCDRDDFDSERAMKIHHTQVHNVSLTQNSFDPEPPEFSNEFEEVLREIDERIKSVEEKYDLDTGIDDISNPMIS